MTILLKNLNYIDVNEGKGVLNTDILLDGCVIRKIGAGAADGKPDATLELNGKWAMPGLINMHEHQTYKRLIGPLYGATGSYAGMTDVDLAIRSVRTALFSLKSGITTILEVGAANDISFSMRDAINRGTIPGPRMFVSGQTRTITGGHAYELAKEIDTVDEMRKDVRENLKKADWVKLLCSHEPVFFGGKEPVGSEMDVALISVAVEEAHRMNKKVGVHAMGSEPIQRVIDSNVDVIHHGAFLTAKQAKEMKQKNIAFVSTFSAYRNTSNPVFERGKQWADDNMVLRPGLESAFQNVLQEGVLIAAGTDSLGDLLHEISFMKRFGMNDAECLRCISINSAKILNQETRLGSIEEGKLADIAIFDKNPLDDFENMRQVALVIKDGTVYDIPNLSLQNLNPRMLLEHTPIF